MSNIEQYDLWNRVTDLRSDTSLEKRFDMNTRATRFNADPVPQYTIRHDHGFVFSQRSLGNLKGVDPRLVSIATLALTYSPIDFIVTDGLRTKEEQQVFFDKGLSKTMNSRHLTGHAIDVAVWHEGDVSWDEKLYASLYVHFKDAADRLNYPLEWGGNWSGSWDSVHYQIPWKA